MKIPKSVLEVLRDGLEERAERFYETQEAFDDFSAEDEESFKAHQRKAAAWLDSLEVGE